MSQEGRSAMRNKAQSTLEYTVLIIVVAAALFAMQAYFKRGAQGKMRESADNLSGGLMYSPGATYSDSLISRSVNEETTSAPNDGENISETKFELNQETTRKETVSAFSNEPRRE
jgi:uncharacterized protein (UPF0333 family)